MLRFSGVRWQVEPVKAESEQKIRRNRSWGKSGARGAAAAAEEDGPWGRAGPWDSPRPPAMLQSKLINEAIPRQG